MRFGSHLLFLFSTFLFYFGVFFVIFKQLKTKKTLWIGGNYILGAKLGKNPINCFKMLTFIHEVPLEHEKMFAIGINIENDLRITAVGVMQCITDRAQRCYWELEYKWCVSTGTAMLRRFAFP